MLCQNYYDSWHPGLILQNEIPPTELIHTEAGQHFNVIPKAWVQTTKHVPFDCQYLWQSIYYNFRAALMVHGCKLVTLLCYVNHDAIYN